MRHFIFLFIASYLFLSCNSEVKVENNNPLSTKDGFYLVEGLSYDVVFQKGDLVEYKGQEIPASHDLDLIVQWRKDDQHFLFVSHEILDSNHRLGDGGHMTKITLNEKGEVIKRENTSFEKVHGTGLNCGGSLGPDGMIYTAEEFPRESNKQLHNNGLWYRDTTQKTEYDRYLDFGWMVQVDPNTNEAVQKMYAMGRYSHEDIQFMPDGKTAYLSDDFMPAIVFKFVADEALDYSKGQLYALKVSGKEMKGEWIELPRDRDSLNVIRDVAARMGASLFARHEWLALDGQHLYIGETGYMEMKYEKHLKSGANMPHYFVKNHQVDSFNYSDQYGRILKLNLETNQMSVELEGGAQGDIEFANPDCIEFVEYKGKKQLFICEDRQGPNKEALCQVFRYDLEYKKLALIMVAPRGAETTGLSFDAKTSDLYLNVQHPSSTNQPPFDKGSTIRIKGLFD